MAPTQDTRLRHLATAGEAPVTPREMRRPVVRGQPAAGGRGRPPRGVRIPHGVRVVAWPWPRQPPDHSRLPTCAWLVSVRTARRPSPVARRCRWSQEPLGAGRLGAVLATMTATFTTRPPSRTFIINA